MLNELWPPPYQVRRSSRARRASLRISTHTGLEVVLPVGQSLARVPVLLNEKRSWIKKHLSLLQQYTLHQPNVALPEYIDLKCVNERWQVHYLFMPIKTRVIPSADCQLTVLGNIDDLADCRQRLQHWIRQKAEQILAPQLRILSEELGLPFKTLTIRAQKTRWGSCSSQKIINLNFKLIFLPSEIVRHIMIHELCHTIHLNHSRKFWQLVARHDPQWQLHHRLSRSSTETQLPAWLYV